jgi:hypothetical protein
MVDLFSKSGPWLRCFDSSTSCVTLTAESMASWPSTPDGSNEVVLALTDKTAVLDLEGCGNGCGGGMESDFFGVSNVISDCERRALKRESERRRDRVGDGGTAAGTKVSDIGLGTCYAKNKDVINT